MVATLRIGVVIVAYRSEEWLERCLDSVLADPRCRRCILVDNDGSGARAGVRAGVTYIRSHTNLGFAGGCNLGFKELRDEPRELDVFATINPDTWLEPGWGHRMLEAFDTHAEYGFLSPLQLTYEDDGELAPWTKAVLGNLPEQPPAILPVEWAEGSALFIRRAIYALLDGFDPIFPLYYEEVDLCRRGRTIGYRTGVVTTARYHHATGGSFDDAHSSARAVLKDLGQMLYIVTDTRHSWLAGHLMLVRLALRRCRLWLNGSYPAFPQLCARALKQQWTQRRNIRAKRRSDAILEKLI